MATRQRKKHTHRFKKKYRMISEQENQYILTIIQRLITNNNPENYIQNLVTLKNLSQLKNEHGQKRFNNLFINKILNVYNTKVFSDDRYKYKLLKKFSLKCDIQSLQILLELGGLKLADKIFYVYNRYKQDEKDTILHLVLKHFVSPFRSCKNMYEKQLIIKLLLKYGADTDVPDWNGRIPLDIAVRHDVPEFIELLSDNPQEYSYKMESEQDILQKQIAGDKILSRYEKNLTKRFENSILQTNTLPLQVLFRQYIRQSQSPRFKDELLRKIFEYVRDGHTSSIVDQYNKNMRQQQIDIQRNIETRLSEFNLSDDEEDGEKCVICYDMLYNGENLVRLDCGHTFHRKCILDYRSRGEGSGRLKCPVCRQDYDENLVL